MSGKETKEQYFSRCLISKVVNHQRYKIPGKLNSQRLAYENVLFLPNQQITFLNSLGLFLVGITIRPSKQTKLMNWNDVIKYAREGSPTPPKRVEKTEAEWKQQLTPEEFHVIRQKGTERAFTGEYCEHHDPGVYACRACGTPLFDSTVKFESGTGWPSFTEPVEQNAVQYDLDTSYGMQRVEVMCNVCDGHLGHVFPDGPPPSGLRYCLNSASIKKVESEA